MICSGEGLQVFIERFERLFTAHGIAEEYSEKIDDLIAPEPTPREAHTLGNLFQHAHASQSVSDDYHLSKPGGC